MKTILFLFITLFVSAQIKGVVVDDKNNPIPYVNIWVENENIGTTAEENGEFSINITSDKNLIFSAMGFEKTIVSARLSQKVVLKQMTFKLNEVLIEKRKESIEREIGNKHNARGTHISGKTSWLNAKFFPYDSSYVKTKHIKNAVVLTRSKVKNASFKLRVFSKAVNGEPDLDLINEDIIVVVKSGRRKNKIDLSKCNLIFPKEGIFIAFESLLLEKLTLQFAARLADVATAGQFAPDVGFQLVV